MKKLIIASILIITMLPLSSCIGGSRVAMLNRYDDSGKAKARCEQVVNAINSRDRDAITAVFSDTALGEAEDIEGGIDYLFALFENDIETWEVTMAIRLSLTTFILLPIPAKKNLEFIYVKIS